MTTPLSHDDAAPVRWSETKTYPVRLVLDRDAGGYLVGARLLGGVPPRSLDVDWPEATEWLLHVERTEAPR